MRSLRLTIPVVTILVLVACSRTTIENPPPEETPPAGYEPAGPVAMENPVTLDLLPVNNSGFSGTATLTGMGDQTNVVVVLNSPAGVEAESDHDVAIRTGTCAAPGAEVEELNDVEANGTASTTELELAIGTIMNGNHALVVEEDGTDSDRAVVCTELPAADQ